MKYFRFVVLLLSIIILMPNINCGKSHKKNDAVVGTWLVESKDAKITIYNHKNKYYGKITWMKNPTYDDGTPKIDKENPDPKLRKRKLQGLVILRGFVYDENNEWEDGEIYDPKTGNDYSCNMTLSDDGKKLDVRGYIGISLFGRTQTWTRVKDKK